MPLDFNGVWKDSFSEDSVPDFYGIKRNAKDDDYFSDSSSTPIPVPAPVESRFCVHPLKQFGMKL